MDIEKGKEEIETMNNTKSKIITKLKIKLPLIRHFVDMIFIYLCMYTYVIFGC